MEIVLFCLGVIGMSHIIIEGKIFEPLRAWLKRKLPPFLYGLFECYQCTGMYAGLICGFLAFSKITWMQIAVAGCAGSFLSSFGAMLFNYLEARTIVHVGEEDGK